MGQVTVQQILQCSYTAFERCHSLPDYVRQAVWALMACHTAVLGGHVQGCPDGHFQRVRYNSCRHRLCPQCAWLQVERWLTHQKARLLACEHYHVIFTLPAELRGLWLTNVRMMTQLFFATVRETLDELLGDVHYLGAQPGFIVALHTWSQTLVLHPHLHCLVTGGGLTAEGQWRAVRNGFLLPARVVMAVFRGKLLAAVDAAVRRGTLTLPDGMPLRHWAILRNKLGRQKWNVYIRERYPHSTGVLTYLARYFRGGPIANQRLVSCTPEAVTLRYRLNAEHAGSPRHGLLTLAIAEFMRRYLLHVPEPGTKVVRCYGLYAPTKREVLAMCRAQLGQGPVVQPPVLDWQTACQARGDNHPERCPVCGCLLMCIGVIPHSRVPPPRGSAAEVAA
jgi:Putative transposase/Transposase zinc-binding domain